VPAGLLIRRGSVPEAKLRMAKRLGRARAVTDIAYVARDLLIILGVKVNVKRLFLVGRDILGIWRIVLSSDIIRIVKIIKS
jgi:hypothetical protein